MSSGFGGPVAHARDNPTDQAVGASVRWHLPHPPGGANADFSADDAALA